ncbi:hypothetical protein Ami103574_06235 [Aminipila butyrica]|uniref:Sigma factor regulator C-terminal domain-containing protein n=1 Tax=Aminipila butyrica TaxID=433296 RepID=A0A858BSR6_9FIRM|nr:anti sigma factor C-terminal domain-containing protein [Aminipila butyrica]QIB68943.1 hypothetical protein Ami103574_06235 [Aminipila butyrica]
MHVSRDLLDQYKKGAATPEESDSIRKEIEKHEAISEFLAEEFTESLPPLDESHDVPSAKKIARKVNVKLFCTILAILLSTAALATAVIASCNLYFYNPNRGIQTTYGGDGQLAVDMMAFTELHSPGYSTYWAEAWQDGLGSYQIRLRQQNLFAGKSEDYSGQIIRGKSFGNNSDTPNGYWHFPLVNAFGSREGKFAYDETGETALSPTVHVKEDLDALAQLPDSCRAAVYVTLSKDLTLEQFSDLYQNWQEDLDFYYAAVASSDDYMPTTIGFAPDSFGTILEKDTLDEKKYPFFQLLGTSSDAANQASIWSTHFTSLLAYLSDRSPFLDAMTSVNGINADYYQGVLNYVDKKGLNIYGLLISGNVQDVQTFLTQESPADFYVSGVRLSNFPD